MNEPNAHPLVSLARRYFVSFYALADEHEAALMDSLVLTRAGLLASIEASREGLSPAVRSDVERASDRIERQFTELRERCARAGLSRACPRWSGR